MYLVKWVGYPESSNSWEPKSNLAHAPDVVKDWERRKKIQKSRS